MSTNTTNTTNTAQKKEKMVTFQPEFVPGTLEDDINISINGKRYIIPRGMESTVPESVYKEYLRSGNAARIAFQNSRKMQYKDPKATGMNNTELSSPLIS